VLFRSLETEKFVDQYLVNLLNLLIKILGECKVLNTSEWQDYMNKLYDQVKRYLTHEHTWVQLASCQLFGLLFSNYNIEYFLSTKSSYFNYSEEPNNIRIRDLIDSFCEQLKSPILEHNLAEQVIKNLAFMAKLVKMYAKGKEEISNGNIEKDAELKHDLNLMWLIKKVVKEAKYELVHKTKETTKRTFIFKWLAAVALDLGKDDIANYLHVIVPPLQREVIVSETDENLKKLAQDVLEFIKQTVGVEDFSDVYSKMKARRVENTEERRRKQAQLAITDPQVLAMKKINRQQKKKEAKKRKQTAYKAASGHVKKKKFAHMDHQDDN